MRKLYVSIVTLSTEDNAKSSKQLSEGFKRLVYWNEYEVIEKRSFHAGEVIGELLDSSYQGVKRLFVLAYYNTDADANLLDVLILSKNTSSKSNK